MWGSSVEMWLIARDLLEVMGASLSIAKFLFIMLVFLVGAVQYFDKRVKSLAHSPIAPNIQQVMKLHVSPQIAPRVG